MNQDNVDMRLSHAEQEINALATRVHKHSNTLTETSNSIGTHEKVCAERWLALSTTMTRVEKSVDSLYARWNTASKAIIGLLAAIAAFLLQRTLYP